MALSPISSKKEGGIGGGAGGGLSSPLGDKKHSHHHLFNFLANQKIQDDLTQQIIAKEEYIRFLEELLREKDIPIPEHIHSVLHPPPLPNTLQSQQPPSATVMSEGSLEELRKVVTNTLDLVRPVDYTVEFHDISYITKVPKEKKIFSVSSIFLNVFCFWWQQCFQQEEKKKKKEIAILNHLTGRILPRKMTLLIGPPGSGKSVFLKALAGHLREAGNAKFSGGVYYDGDNINPRNHPRRFIVQKVSDYIEQGDTHDAVLTVEETLKFAWMCATGGHHAYSRFKDAESAEILNRDDPHFGVVNNVIVSLGLKSCKDTYVGNGMIRGISGGQKRRVTMGEMVVRPRPIKFMDSISNGLDSATTYDIIRAVSLLNHTIGLTTLVSLLQPPPEVYSLFDEIILLCEGHIIYQGSREGILPYFESLGYERPPHVDEADFLQELPTIEGARFVKTPTIPHTPQALARAWKSSDHFLQILAEMRYPSLKDAMELEKSNTKEWYPEQKELFASPSFWFYFKLNLERQTKIFRRDNTFAKARIGQVFLIGAIAGSLFSNIPATEISTLNGFLFNTLLFNALSSFAILPLMYQQKAIFYKMKDALFFPTLSYTLAQNLTILPLQIVENIIYITIVYWSAGLSSEENGSRFLTFILISLIFSMTVGQLFRVIAAVVPSTGAAMPVAGILIIIMVLFSGFIQPKALIPPGWIWFYWLNPLAYALKAVTVNELKSSTYDFMTCVNPLCTATKRFGDFVLEQYGNPTDGRWIWYSFAVLIGEYIFFFILTTLCLHYVRIETAPAAPERTEENGEVPVKSSEKLNTPAPVAASNNLSLSLEMVELGISDKTSEKRKKFEQLPFDHVSLAFKDIWYTVTLANGEDVDLLKGVSGFFEPGTITALMGSSGAGKTTLLDVLAGRKNTGVVKGEIYLNGLPKIETYFRKIMGYVEQFDTLPQKSTAREAIAFSAALRLARGISTADREKWIDSVLSMLDLNPIANDLIGRMDAGGMSFEQRKRVSIGVELAANPSILFLDEPTTGLDSLAAQSLVRNIRTIAESGRSIVCTIHQPSAVIFNSFDSLLLLRRGGQTVYFGKLGEQSSNLIDYFQSIPGVDPLPPNTNPANWMLEIIGAGTSSRSNKGSFALPDFHEFYNASGLCRVNLLQLDILAHPNEGSRKLDEHEIIDKGGFNASYWTQFTLLMQRIALTYWRTPTYSFVRHVTNIFIALIFGSAYPQQKYSDYVAVVSRSAVIYITSLFCGILAMLLVTPVLSVERPVFYREQQSRMYSVFIYVLTLVLIEIPYLLVSSIAFTLPFFFIVGFNNTGNATERFFWYWFFNFLLQGTMLFIGEFFVALAPNEQVSQVLGGLNNTVLGLFCGFLIAQQNFPTFWLFMYWINPLHYALEGLISSQFHGDDTKITTMNGVVVTAEAYIRDYQFTNWSYDHIGFDVLALGIFIGFAITGNYLCLAFMRHDKR